MDEAKGSVKQVEVPGDHDKTFDDIGLNDVEDKGNGIRVGKTDSGRKVVARPSTKDKRPTLEVQTPRGNPKVKIRFNGSGQGQ